ncbi:MAG: GNAT family N-acetyltransferase [Oscillospiraceae bacterium]|jgi:GNAT superfamily N-acetyltransferase|nr:GNAT family N-acetyltransferase [Oscillospiraceae bacterium]
MSVTLRKGTDADAELIIGYLKKLAEYEKLGDMCNITAEVLIKLMSEENGLHAVIAEQDGVPAGMMTWYVYKIATFSGRRVFYIEDVFIDESKRGEGIGSALFADAKRLAAELGCARLEWKCLDWNKSAQSFYEKIGGNLSDDGWLTYTINLK